MPGTTRQTGTKPGKAPKPTATAKRSAGKATPAPAKPAGRRKAAAAPAKSPPPAKKPAPPAPARKDTRGAAAARPASRPAERKAPPKPPKSAAKGKAAAASRSSIDVAFAINRLHQVALLATDLEKSIAFYRDILGLTYMDRYDPPGLAFFNLGGGTRLILSATSSKATLYFRVDDIDSAVSALAARGVFFLHKPSMIHRDDQGRLGKKGVEEWMAFFKDPSDNVLALVAQR